MIDAVFPAMEVITYRGTDGKRVTVKDAVYDPVAFTRMNDSLIDLIQNSQDPALQKSQAILDAMAKREIYGHCGQSRAGLRIVGATVDVAGVCVDRRIAASCTRMLSNPLTSAYTRVFEFT